MEHESIYNKIQELFGMIPENYNILEEEIDINLQMEYFDFSKKVKRNMTDDDKVEERYFLFEEDTIVDKKKEILVKLASLEDVQAYRAIEQYLEEPDNGLRQWAVLALQESRMLLQSNLLDENQVFISTGLGGKGNKLRYFIVLLTKDEMVFDETRKKVVNNEFGAILTAQDIEIEEVHFFNHFCTISAVIPMDVAIKQVFKNAINECNHFGDFLRDHFIVTNVKKLSESDIESFIREHAEELDNPGFDDEDLDELPGMDADD